MCTFKGYHFEEMNQGLYSCIVESICAAGFDFNEDVLWASIFSPIMYDSLLITKGSGKSHQYDAAGGGTIIFSWGAIAPLKILAMKTDLVGYLPRNANSIGEVLFKKQGKMNVTYISRRANFFREHQACQVKSGTAFSVAVFLSEDAPTGSTMVQISKRADMLSH